MYRNDPDDAFASKLWVVHWQHGGLGGAIAQLAVAVAAPGVDGAGCLQSELRLLHSLLLCPLHQVGKLLRVAAQHNRGGTLECVQTSNTPTSNVTTYSRIRCSNSPREPSVGCPMARSTHTIVARLTLVKSSPYQYARVFRLAVCC